MVKAVLFDLFETLVTESNTAVPRAASLGERLGLDPVAFKAEWKAVRPGVLRGQLSFAQALTDIATRLGTAVSRDTVERLREERLRAKAAVLGRIDPELLAMTYDLNRRGIRLAVVSNCFAEDVDAWSRCPLASEFHRVVFSFAIGTVKPEPGIYLQAANQLGVAAADTMFVGDDVGDELAGAQRAGLRAAAADWFTGSAAPRRAPLTVSRLSNPQALMELMF